MYIDFQGIKGKYISKQHCTVSQWITSITCASVLGFSKAQFHWKKYNLSKSRKKLLYIHTTFWKTDSPIQEFCVKLAQKSVQVLAVQKFLKWKYFK